MTFRGTQRYADLDPGEVPRWLAAVDRAREHGGPTKTANGPLLCRHHHRLLHEYGWKLSVIDGRWVATDPHGTTWTGRPRAPDQPAAKTAS